MDTEEKIILAALRQFEARGFVAATTKSIAAEAGVAEVTLFRCFGDKKSLFNRVVAYIAGEFGLTNLPGMGTGDLRRDARYLCQRVLRHFIKYNALVRMLVFEMKNHGEIRTVIADVRRRAVENAQKLLLLYRGPDTNVCTADSMEWLMNCLIGASLCYCLFHEADDPDAYVRLHAGMIADAFVDQITIAGK